MLEDVELLDIAISLGFALVMLSVLLGFVRLARGPTLADRVVALDMMTVSIVAFCAIFAIYADSSVFLDVGIVLALVGFLATVALARFAERRLERERVETVRPPTEQLEGVAETHRGDPAEAEPRE